MKDISSLRLFYLVGWVYLALNNMLVIYVRDAAVGREREIVEAFYFKVNGKYRLYLRS